MTCALVSGVTLYHYQLSLWDVLIENLYQSESVDWDRPHFVPKDAPLKWTDQENTAVAINSLVVIFSTIDIALAVCGAWSSDPPYQFPQHNQVSQVCVVIPITRVQKG